MASREIGTAERNRLKLDKYVPVTASFFFFCLREGGHGEFGGIFSPRTKEPFTHIFSLISASVCRSPLGHCLCNSLGGLC